ncbi:hypothetical protein ENUP19_0347G0050 [Entamoeba nuttalli]|uniref:non-specific serine/threonine protein kinase n=2 Tax=Entamoeba nuttalli TaxID=412467 RepID=K2HYF4_ENTNP|nr:PH domain containing protein kinase, putative [Entamoeba nuttalli P19]EKE41425.1 PH domain containing protein kinase, putative [Entamoeba nuttalli P19]|eukprot:XP_008856238.1 PH domain containing protein kinase, putative [Entamoeba nuttalli P19]
MSTNHVVKKTGWLVKEGGKWKSWKRRFFVFEQTTLSYYKDQLLFSKMGEIPLELATCIEPVRRYKKHDYVFKIVTPSRTYYINCADEKDMNDWISCLKDISDRINVSLDKSEDKCVNSEDFDIISLIGKGAFGKVYLVKNKETQTLFAMKVIQKKQVIERDEVQHSLEEKNILAKIKHPFLVNLYCSFQTSVNLHYVIDYCPGGELYSLMKKEQTMNEKRTKFYAGQLVLALEHLHNQGIIYRDVKPENILICADGYIRLTDFGLSKMGISDNSKTATFCGTPEYLAPEVIQNVAYTNAIDWWGLGVLIYEMLYGTVPFYDENIQRLYHNILYNQVTFLEHTEISLECRDIISQLLKKNPIERLHETDAIKSHPWFHNLHWDNLFAKKVLPDYLPQLSSPTDLRYFYNEITEESLSLGGEAVSNELFTDFTYSTTQNQL